MSDGAGGPGRWRRRVRWFLLLVPLAGLVAFLVLRQPSGGAAGKLDKSLVATVRRADLQVTVLETGRIEPRAQSQIKSRLGGQVIDVTVEEGQSVKVGQLLVRLEPTDYRREVARMDAEVEQMRLTLEHAERERERTRRARERNVAAQMEVDQNENQAALARARLSAGRVALATARDRLRYTEIEAPIAGTVVQRNIQPGEAVVPGATSTFEGKPLLVIADLSVLLVKIDLNQIDVAKVRKGMEAVITLDALPGKSYKAHVTRVAPASVSSGSPRGGSQGGPDVFPVEAVLDADQDLKEIKPGMTADVRILVETKKNVLLLPIEAVQSQGARNKVVWLDHADKEIKKVERDVTVGGRNDREIELLTGLAVGDQVLIQPPPPEKR